jgi:hypothetical protein
MATVAIKRSMITDIFSCKWNANEMVPWTGGFRGVAPNFMGVTRRV